MAKVKNAFQTYDAKGNREDLSNAIYNIDPFDTPVMSMCKRRKVRNRTFDWQTEKLPDTLSDNAQEEGFVLDRTASTPTVRETNVTQISKRDATVTGSQEASDAAGKGSEMAHQMAMESKRLKSDMEMVMCGPQGRADGSSTDAESGVARKTESIFHWIARASNGSERNAAVVGYKSGTGTSRGVGEHNKALPQDNNDIISGTTDGAGTSNDTRVTFTESLLGDAMEMAYDRGAKPSMLFVSPHHKRGVSTFDGRENSRIQVGRSEVVQTVDVIMTDFGTIKVIPTRWLSTKRLGTVGTNTNGADTTGSRDIYALLLDPMYVACAFFRNFMQKPIARIGDAETRMILAEWGIEMRNPLAHVVFYGIKRQGTVGSAADSN